MQVILLDDVQNLGHEGDIITVADGYARNYLIPQKLAAQATNQAREELEQRRGAIEQRQDQKQLEARTLAEQLREKAIIIEASVGESGRLHGQITPHQIAEAAADQFGLTIDRRDIDIPVPIRETGDYLISATLYKDVVAELPVHVVAAGAAPSEQVEQTSEEPVGEEETGPPSA